MQFLSSEFATLHLANLSARSIWLKSELWNPIVVLDIGSWPVGIAGNRSTRPGVEPPQMSHPPLSGAAARAVRPAAAAAPPRQRETREW